MKIGILTYHRVHNFGALLQAVALRYVLQNMGHQVYYVDYYPPYHRRIYKVFSWHDFFSRDTIRKKMRYVIDRVTQYPYRRERQRNFNDFISNEIIPYCRSVDEKYDVVFYGSDQIWRIQKDFNDFNPTYFGAGCIKASRHVSYAASMGTVCLSIPQQERFKYLVSHLDVISVREAALKSLLQSMNFNNVEQVVDPTLLLRDQEWNRLFPTKKIQKKKYLLFYDLMKGSFREDGVYNFANKKGLDVIVLSGSATSAPSGTMVTTAGPYQFLDLICGAEFVCTSSFHGLAFSLIFNKQFFVSFKTNSERAESLLASLGISERLLKSNSEELSIWEDINYEIVNDKLIHLKDSSLKFIRECLYSKVNPG